MPIQQDTTSFGKYLPGLVEMYQENKPIDIEYRFEKCGNFSVRENHDTVAFDITVRVIFWVHSDENVIEKAIDLNIE